MTNSFQDAGAGFPRVYSRMINRFSQNPRHSTVVVVPMRTIDRNRYCTFHSTNLAGGCDNPVSAGLIISQKKSDDMVGLH